MDNMEEGVVRNTLYTLEPSISAAPKILTGFMKPARPLFADDALVKSNAVFGGVAEDQ